MINRLRPAAFSAFSLALVVSSTAAFAQLQQFGIQNSNQDAGTQQRMEQQQNTPGANGACVDPDPSHCGGSGVNASAPIGQPGEFQFNQPQQGNYSQERSQPRLIFQPQAPSAFQRYVGETTGIWLQVYGSELFTNVPSTFAPLTGANATPDYTIGPGDEILLQAYGQISFDLRLTVERDGTINIPRVGAVRVAGLKYDQLHDFLQRAIGKNFRNFDLNVALGQLRSIQVFTLGEARRPGNYTISSLSTLLNAVFATGGPTLDGSLRHVQLRRGGKIITELDFYDVLLRGDASADVPLVAGDIIFYPKAGPRAAIFGGVARPAIYELKDTNDSSLAALTKDAGGLTVLAADKRAEVERTDKSDNSRHVIEVPLTASPDLAIADGDIVRVFMLPPRFDNAVTLRGNVANPGRYAWHEGMRVRDVIPDRESLVTRDYWRDRARLGLPVIEYAPTPVTDPTADTLQTYQQRVISGNRAAIETSQRAQVANGNLVDGNIDPSTGRPYGPDNSQPNQQQSNQYNQQQSNQYNQPNQQSGQQSSNQQRSSNSAGTRVGNGDLVSAGASSINGSTIGSTSSSSGNAAGNATAAFNAPPLPQNFPAKNIVEMPAPQIDWSYAVVERMDKQTLRTSLIPFDLGRLVLDGDSSQDQLLQPGDVVTVFSQADIHVPRQQQARLVRIEGEVKNGGTYSVLPGETLRQVVERAGGLTPNAYLYGSSFTRETTREQQQQRLDEYVTRISAELDHAAAQAAADAAVDGSGSATPLSSENRNQIVQQLRSLRASGRIVLNLSPGDHEVAAMPDIPLEDGDHLVIPAVPSDVTVIGSVYNQSSFLFEDGSRAGEYLRKAGGPDRLGDQKHEYVVRADGSVVSRDRGNSGFLSGFDSTRMNPGDTIIIPEKLIKPSNVRSLLAYASIFSSLALTAATIAVLQ